jgi:hypothetical protein
LDWQYRNILSAVSGRLPIPSRMPSPVLCRPASPVCLGLLACLPTCLPACLIACLPVCLSVCLLARIVRGVALCLVFSEDECPPIETKPVPQRPRSLIHSQLTVRRQAHRLSPHQQQALGRQLGSYRWFVLWVVVGTRARITTVEQHIGSPQWNCSINPFLIHVQDVLRESRVELNRRDDGTLTTIPRVERLASGSGHVTALAVEGSARWSPTTTLTPICRARHGTR